MRRALARGCQWMVFAAACAASGAAYGQQTQRFALDQFYPAPAGDRFFAVQGGDVGGHLNPRAMLLGEYAYRPLVLYDAETDKALSPLVSDQMFLHLGAAVGLWNRLSLSADLPVALVTRGESLNTASGTIAAPSGSSIGDLRFGARVNVVGEPKSAVTFGLAGYFWMGTGDRQQFVRDRRPRGMPALVLAGETTSFAWAVNAGVLFRPESMFAETTMGTQLAFGGAFGLLLADRKLQVGPELYGAAAVAGEDSFQVGTTNFEAILGGRYHVGPVVVGAGVGPGLTRGIGTPALRAVASVTYVPEPTKAAREPRDADGDGILDARDACPFDPGPKSEDRSESGCPDLDKDGIRDPNDACVDSPGPANDDPKLNGCPKDRDGDGVANDDDACPEVKGPKNEDPKLNGCPPDRDGDGVWDDDDACPDTKGTENEDETRNGCVGDADGDEIMDDQDACPHEKGSSDSDAKKNGCPTLVRVTENEIVILEPIQFKAGSDEVPDEGEEALQQVAAVLREHPEISKIEVRGYTDDRGKAAQNKKLSEKRAQAVMKWLSTRGVIDDDRLTSKGYGSEDSIADNDTPEGRKKNNRIQIKIVEKKKKSKKSD